MLLLSVSLHCCSACACLPVPVPDTRTFRNARAVPGTAAGLSRSHPLLSPSTQSTHPHTERAVSAEGRTELLQHPGRLGRGDEQQDKPAQREMQSNLCGAAGCVEAVSGLSDVTVHHQDPWPPRLSPHAVQLNHTSRTCPEKFAELVTAPLTSPGQRQPLRMASRGLLHRPPARPTPTPGPAAPAARGTVMHHRLKFSFLVKENLKEVITETDKATQIKAFAGGTCYFRPDIPAPNICIM